MLDNRLVVDCPQGAPTRIDYDRPFTEIDEATMGRRDDWMAVRANTPTAGLAHLAADFEANHADASCALDLVAAQMWLRRYEEAERTCALAEQARHVNMSTSCFPIQRGTALWCLGRFAEAEHCWQSAENANYADTAGANVHYLLLLAADGLRNRKFPVNVRAAIDKKRTDTRVHSSWPGPLALYLQGIYGASMVLKLSDKSRDGRWQFHFYQALKSYAQRGDAQAFREELSLLSSQVEAETDLEEFVDFARTPEVHLARELPSVLEVTPG
jgi:hypothetical protein